MNVPKDKVSTELKGATEDALEPITSSLSNEPRHEQSPIATPQPLETTLFSPPVPQTEEEDFLAASPKRPRSPSPPRAFTASPDFAPPAQRSRLSSPSSNQPLINKPERSFSLPTDSSTHGLLSMSMSSPIRRRSFGGGDAREGVQEEVVEIAVKGAANEARKRGMSFKGVGNETDGSGEGGSGDGRETEETSGEGELIHDCYESPPSSYSLTWLCRFFDNSSYLNSSSLDQYHRVANPSPPSTTSSRASCTILRALASTSLSTYNHST